MLFKILQKHACSEKTCCTDTCPDVLCEHRKSCFLCVFSRIKWKCRLLNNSAVNAKLLRNDQLHFVWEKTCKKYYFRCSPSMSGNVSVQWAVNSMSNNVEHLATSIQCDLNIELQMYKYRAQNLQTPSSKPADTELKTCRRKLKATGIWG